ncbi:MAG: hypothetical protein ACJAZ1_002073 [Yoonia sp.]|jgi:hypothetical protein
MFFGAVPADCIAQVFKIMDIENWTDAHVCCSGTFRIERALSATYPNLRIHSNDVSPFSEAIGRVSEGKPFNMRFREDLEPLNKFLDGGTDLDRAAAVMIACELARHCVRKTRYDIQHFNYWFDGFEHHLPVVKEKLEERCSIANVTSYFSGDWITHALDGVTRGSGILAFPPFFMGDYEKQFEFVNKTVEWDEPEYPMYDPSQLRGIVENLDSLNAKYCVLTDQVWTGMKPKLQFQNMTKVPHFCYSSDEKSSLIQKRKNPKPFSFKMVDDVNLTRKSKVEVKAVDGAHLYYLKNIFLAKGITHTPGSGNYLVYVDGGLVGGIIYTTGPITRHAFGASTCVVLSDVCVTRKRKLSKLVSMLSMCRDLLRPVEYASFERYTHVVTTARSKNPSSMKYRGIMKRITKRLGDNENEKWIMNYAAKVREQSPTQIYQEWWDRYGKTPD